jgi:hypothetical protein
MLSSQMIEHRSSTPDPTGNRSTAFVDGGSMLLKSCLRRSAALCSQLWRIYALCSVATLAEPSRGLR